MNSRAIKFAALSTLALGVNLATAHGDTFGSGADAFAIDFVNIGNPGNADDAGAGGGLYSSPYGGVSYGYRMGVTEVPQDWITKATNLGLTNVTADGFSGLQPAANMTWYEAAAFVNWLNTTTGHQAAYQLDAGNTTLTLWNSGQAWQLGGENLYRHKDAYYFLPSEDEWYKAAFHKNDGVTANYWDYATGSNSPPAAVANGTGAGTAVYNGQLTTAAVDNDGGLSAYGTRGQNGNVYEWHESAFDGLNDSSFEARAVRSGLWGNSEVDLRSSFRFGSSPGSSDVHVGLRVASVPEFSCAMLMFSGSLLAFARRRRPTAVCRSMESIVYMPDSGGRRRHPRPLRRGSDRRDPSAALLFRIVTQVETERV